MPLQLYFILPRNGATLRKRRESSRPVTPTALCLSFFFRIFYSFAFRPPTHLGACDIQADLPLFFFFSWVLFSFCLVFLGYYCICVITLFYLSNRIALPI
jgi:hypothetical protein